MRPTRPPSAAEQPRARRSTVQSAVAAIFAALVGLAGMKLAPLLLAAPPAGASRALLGWSVAALPLLWLVAVAAHEFGHLAGGWIGGGRLLLFAAGPFQWQRTPSGLHFGWNRRTNFAGGLAACLPFDGTPMTPARMALMIAGGPLASLLLGGVAAGAAAWLVARAGDSRLLTVAQHLAVFLAFISLLVAVITALPTQAGGFKSDGRRLAGLLGGGPRADQEKAVLALTAASLGGIRPADYDPVLVQQATALRDGSLFDRYAHLTAYAHAADLADYARAQACLDHVLAGEADLAPLVRHSVYCEYAWLVATRTADAATARAWLEAAGPAETDSATSLRAEAAVLLAEGRPADAALRAKEGLEALERRSLSPTVNPFHADLLRDLLRRASGG